MANFLTKYEGLFEQLLRSGLHEHRAFLRANLTVLISRILQESGLIELSHFETQPSGC